MSAEPSRLTRILIVDDSKLMVKAAHKMLAGEFDVIDAKDGLEAWDALERDATIQVVFTDLNMPRSDGYDLLQRIRNSPEGGLQGMPVIVVTGADNDEAERMKALNMGATDFITKPFTSIDLLARARAHAKYQRITQQLQAQTTHDVLTGLSNKTGFLDRLQQDIAYARRHAQVLSLIRLEIEGLRDIFLKQGKEFAEGIVAHVALHAQARVRPEDTAARIGLGGFALSMPGGKPEGLELWIERFRAELASEPPTIDGKSVPIQLSSALISAELQHWASAQEALDQCQAKLDASRPKPVAAPVTKSAPASAPAAVGTATAPSEPPPLRLDVLLDQVQQGDTHDATKYMPQVLQRLVPLLRLLTAKQRTQLIHFLQKLGGA